MRAAKGLGGEPSMFSEAGQICSALPVGPLCTHRHITQIHRSEAWNERTRASEQHRKDGSAREGDRE